MRTHHEHAATNLQRTATAGIAASKPRAGTAMLSGRGTASRQTRRRPEAAELAVKHDRRALVTCDDLGRDYDAIRKTILANNPSPDNQDEFVREMAKYAELGVHSVMVMPTTGSPATWIEGTAPTVRRRSELG